MSTPSIYINLPVADLDKAIAFYKALGFTQNLQFTDENASAMAYNEHVIVMLLTHGFTAQFLPAGKTVADSHKTCEVLNAIAFESREAVDIFFDKAIAAGGKATIATQDHGFMYGRDFEDLDGHIWEPFWMDVGAIPQE